MTIRRRSITRSRARNSPTIMAITINWRAARNGARAKTAATEAANDRKRAYQRDDRQPAHRRGPVAVGFCVGERRLRQDARAHQPRRKAAVELGWPFDHSFYHLHP